MSTRALLLLFLFAPTTVLFADEGMWCLDRLPTDALQSKYRVSLSPGDVAKLRHAPVRLLQRGEKISSGGSRVLGGREHRAEVIAGMAGLALARLAVVEI